MTGDSGQRIYWVTKDWRSAGTPMIKYRNNLGHETYHPLSSAPQIPVDGWIEIEMMDGSWKRYVWTSA